MTSQDPLKSVISIGNVDDTSLAVPSAHQCRSGQQRVLEQVQTIRRTRSRQSSSGRSASTSLTPTSPGYEPVFMEPLKSQSSTSNGSVFFGNGFNKTHTVEKNMKQQVVNTAKESTAKRNFAFSTHHYERKYAPTGSKPSRSEPDLVRQRSVPAPKRSVPLQRFLSNRGTHNTERPSSMFVTPPKGHAQYAVNGFINSKTTSQVKYSEVDGSKSKRLPKQTQREHGTNGSGGVVDLTMKEAVECLSSTNETYQHCGASYIQHNAFIDDGAKEEVLKVKGISPLVALLRSPNSQVSHTASAALRNLSFKSNTSKEAIHHSSGIEETVALLQQTDSVEIQKQLTGLLWNLSSADNLKPDLLKSALPVVMERVILPNNSNSQDPEVFYNSTGFLRNLSSAKQNNRQVMRKCRGLVDSLVGYVKECVEAGNPDDKSVENCVCILHNLTFQLEDEAPALFSRITALAKPLDRSHSQGDNGPIGCFSPQNKSSEQEHHFDYPVVEDSQPSGAGLLFHSKTMQSYLDLLESSQQADTQEACCGALQNLTAHEGIVSKVMSQTIVQKLNGMQVIGPLLRSNKVNLQKNIVALVGNLTKNPNLHNSIARKALPDLLDIITAGTKGGNESDDTLSMTCQAANCLLMKEPEIGKHLIKANLIKSLNDLSQNNYFPKSSKAASLLLHNLWSEKDLQSFLKKLGMTKSSFMNDTIASALKSVQVVD
ncbi:plakophilin-1 isoform X1 [Solea solea]|uniref:plakophilin-1 isoform X1 n=1 Tax=Solea solea TaxID=90069 RepID=UPI00272BA286|nr:plakophilin-1 isoform X1 [Solea solea]